MEDKPILLYESLLDWEWYNDHNITRLFIHCLLKAHKTDVKYRGQIIKRGSFIIGRDDLSKETGLPVQQLRTCVKKLISTSDLTTKSTSVGTLITICKYDTYQSGVSETNQQINQPFNQKLTSDQPATNQRPTSNQPAPVNPHVKIDDDIVERTISYLNKKAGSSYKVTGNYRYLIGARLAESYTADDLIKVIDNMCDTWLGTPEQKWLTATTLFAEDKFDKYLNQPVVLSQAKLDKEKRQMQIKGELNG